MGEILAVHCPHCGYSEESLFGVGGDIGMMGELVVTAVCTKNGRLVDTDAGSAFDPERPGQYKNGPFLPGRCPEGNCGSRNHVAWDPETAICPACGEARCIVGSVGVWD